MDQWKTRLGGRKEPLDRNATDHEIWEFLLFSTQYRTISEVHAAISATKPPEISRKSAEVIWNTFIQQFVYIIRRSTAMPGTDGQPSIVYPARFILQEINKKTNNQLVNTYAIWIDEFPSGKKNFGKFSDAIYDLGQAFTQKMTENQNLELSNVKILFGNKPSFRGPSQSRGPSRGHPRESRGGGRGRHHPKQTPSGQWCGICNTDKHAEEKCFSVVGRPGSKKRRGGDGSKRDNSVNKSDEYSSFNLTNNSLKKI
ncbi:hypothetical protein P9112_013518 [Eukaryota sp. TZLM1-RC]